MDKATRIAQLGQVLPDLELWQLELICEQHDERRLLNILASVSIRTAHVLWAINDAIDAQDHEADVEDFRAKSAMRHLVQAVRAILPDWKS